MVQELKETDHYQRRNFAFWMTERAEGFSKKIIFSDEAHFHLSGYVNKQNCRIWGDENPHVYHEQPLHALKTIVWCGLGSEGIIGPYFSENEAGQTATINGERYRNMLTNYFWHELDGMDQEETWFQQNGATAHTSGETMALLPDRLEERLISRNGLVNWPPRSCDLTPLDFFLWDFFENIVYANKPATIQDLKINIRTEITAISTEILRNIVENYDIRVLACTRSRGGHLSNVIFHT